METHIGKLILNRMKTYHHKVMMRIKRKEEWQNFTGEAVHDMLHKTAFSLLHEDVKYQENIGIYSQNMPEWSFADIGSLIIGAVPTPVYATSVADQLKYILIDAEIKILFVGEQEQYTEVLKIYQEDDVLLKRIVVFDRQVKLETEHSIYFDEWIKEGKDAYVEEYNRRQKRLNGEDLATIIYTSGTTGEPKGVMLTHHNILESCRNHDLKYNLNDQHTSLCFLPLSHVFERAWTYYIFHKGMMNTYMDSPKKIAETLLEAKPTVLCSVPRLYEKIYDGIHTKVAESSRLKKKLFFWSVRMGGLAEDARVSKRKLGTWRRFQYFLANKLVLSKIRERMGGNLQFMPCGGAFLGDQITEFFRAVGLPVVIGYGLTETSATVSSYDLYNYQLGTVGIPLPNVEIKIGKENEILVKSKGVMKGYYKKPEETARVFEGEWFKTGDAGHFDENNNLIITDRIKDLMKTSGGKYIAPQKIESVLTKHNLIEQALIIGDGKPYVTALLTPNFEALKAWAKKSNLIFDNYNDLITKSQIIEKYQAVITELQTSLSRFEKVKKFKLMAREFSIEMGEMTPTFKLKRKIIIKKYHDMIEEMYKKIINNF